MANIKKIKLPNGQVYDIYDAGALRASDLEQAKIDIKAEILGSAPEELNTLEELAAALNEDENFSTTILNLIGSKEAALLEAIEEVDNNHSAVIVTKNGETKLLDTFNIVKLTQEEYNNLVSNNSINPDALYLIEDGEGGIISHSVSFTQTQTSGNEIGKLTINDITTTLYSPITTKAGLGLGNVENKSSATIRSELTKANVTAALGYTPPETDTTYDTVTTTVDGLMSVADKVKLDGIAAGADSVSFSQTQTSGNEIGKITINSNETVLYSPSVTKTSIGLDNVENKSSATIRSEITSSNVTTALGYTPPRQDTTYNNASTTAAGLMSAADKVKLDGLSNSSPNVLTSLPSSGTALSDNTIYTVANAITSYTFKPPISGWAHGTFSTGSSASISFVGNFISAAPSIEANKVYEFDVWSNIWAVQEVVNE